MKTFKSRLFTSIIVVFLFTFMLAIFGPSEIFFSNYSQFEFLFGEFIWMMVALSCVATIVFSIVISLLPEKIYKTLLALITGIGVASYVQVMFLNKELDLLGLNPDGNKTSAGACIVNLLIWFVILVGFILIAIKKNSISQKIFAGLAGFLIAIQLVALVSLIISAPKECFERQQTENYMLDGSKQMTVSSKDNVIVFVLDYFSNQYIEPMLAEYPDAIDFLHDFTYYDNDECVYHGTYPSMAHMFSGQEMDPSIPSQEWAKNIWESETVDSFYKKMAKDKNYEVNIYTPIVDVLVVENSYSLLSGVFDNIKDSSVDVTVDRPLLTKTLVKMSGYRMFPLAIKNAFYTDNSEISNIVLEVNNVRAHENYAFMERLKNEGLSLDNDSNIMTIQHLEGAHEWHTAADGSYKDESSREETCRGCMAIVETYIDSLKAVGKYDSSTIIITSDHGGEYDPQVIFFIKKPNENHDEMLVSHAQITHCELLPTLAEAMGADATPYGSTVDMIDENISRERLYFHHTYDPEYPYVKHATSGSDAAINVYNVYSYIGDYSNLKEKLDNNDRYAVLPMVDIYY